jgi:hypothetical protein
MSKKPEIHYINDSRFKGYYFFWHNKMKLYPTKEEAATALIVLIQGGSSK